MNLIAINGGPRTNHNTAALLNKAIEGAIANGASVETVNLYSLNYKGCTACFSCKRKGSKSLHNCAMRDDLTPVLERIKQADGIIFASPIYLYDLTGEMRSFMERLIFQYLPYDIDVKERTYFPRPVKTLFLYTMGAPEGMLTEKLRLMEDFIAQIFRVPVKTLYSCHAYPFLDDCSNYESSPRALAPHIKHREEVFPLECEKAYALGAEMAR